MSLWKLLRKLVANKTNKIVACLVARTLCGVQRCGVIVKGCPLGLVAHLRCLNMEIGLPPERLSLIGLPSSPCHCSKRWLE